MENLKRLNSKLSLSPLESAIMAELKEAGSEEIVTIIATVHKCIDYESQKLPTICTALKNLFNLRLIRFSKNEYINYRNTLIAIDNNIVNMIFNYLTTCSWNDWWICHRLGPCEKIELELVYVWA
jgi:hypothetical protein